MILIVFIDYFYNNIIVLNEYWIVYISRNIIL